MSETTLKKNCLIVSRPSSETMRQLNPALEESRDNSRDNTETITLKALANRHFSRDKERDKSETISHEGPKRIVSPSHIVTNPDETNKSGAITPEDAAYFAAERATFIAGRQHGNAASPVVHALPPSWGDPRIEPTAGAFCHCCKGATWWCEATSPTGWRCVSCHPGEHLSADQHRHVKT